MPKPGHTELSLRIVVEEPVPGVRLMLQRGRAELVPPTRLAREGAAFDLALRLGAPRPGGGPNFVGPFAQGPPAARFVYVNAGRRAGQAGTLWDRRAKVPLTGITTSQVKAVLAQPGARLEVRIPGRGRDGGPTCGSVRLRPGAWQVYRAEA